MKLGSQVRDKVSGLTGIAVARHEFLNGCVRISVQQPIDKDGKLPDEKWFDEGQIEIIGEGIVMPTKAVATGGPVGNSPPWMQRGAQ